MQTILLNKGRQTILSFCLLLIVQQAVPQKLPSRIPYRKGDKWGYCDSNKKILIVPQYAMAANFSDGLACVKKNNHFYFNDTSGRVIIKNLRSLCHFKEGLAVIDTGVSDKAVIDKKGKMIVAPGYEEIDDFRNGLATVKTELWGLVNAKGKVVVPPTYVWMGLADDDPILVVKNTGSGEEVYGFIKRDGQVSIPLQYRFISSYGFQNNRARVIMEEAFGFINKKGDSITAFIYDDADDFSEGMARVRKKDKWGYIDTTGKEVIAMTYESADEFQSGLAAVKINGKWGFINKKAELVIEAKYEDTPGFYNDIAAVVLNGKTGAIDLKGLQVFDFNYKGITFFQVPGTAYNSESQCWLVDKTGKDLPSGNYKMIGAFINGIAEVTTLDNRKGYIDKKGRAYFEE